MQNTEDQYLNDSHLKARKAFEQIPHLKKGEVTAVGIPLGLTGTPGRTTRARVVRPGVPVSPSGIPTAVTSPFLR